MWMLQPVPPSVLLYTALPELQYTVLDVPGSTAKPWQLRDKDSFEKLTPWSMLLYMPLVLPPTDRKMVASLGAMASARARVAAPGSGPDEKFIPSLDE